MKIYKTKDREECIKWLKSYGVDVYVPEKDAVWKRIPSERVSYALAVRNKRCIKAKLIGVKTNGDESHHTFWDKVKYDETEVRFRPYLFPSAEVGEQRKRTTKRFADAYRKFYHNSRTFKSR